MFVYMLEFNCCCLTGLSKRTKICSNNEKRIKNIKKVDSNEYSCYIYNCTNRSFKL